ncbi:CBS domain-containing protein [Ileibacterium valens]|uniref:CBS domain-containing protein n=2 Tax=Ileibacterium valens TaxID=1862668 RepID=UPI00259B7908|nr:CBS domain-containing protein [Ileibacterium valens]
MINDNVFFFLKFKNDVRFFYDSLPLSQALILMKKHGYSAVPVVSRSGVYLGSVSEGDFLWFLLEHGNDEKALENHTISELIREGFMPAAPNTISFEDLLAISLNQNYVPIVDDRNIFIGIVTRQAILNYFLESRRSLSLSPKMIELERYEKPLAAKSLHV